MASAQRGQAQRGQVFKRGGVWNVRYYDEDGNRRQRAGFGEGRDGKQAATDWVTAKVSEVEALRRGDPVAHARRQPVTLAELVDQFLRAHPVDEATTRKLRRQLRRPVAVFGDRQLRSLTAGELAAWRSDLPPGVRHDYFRALRQALEQATRWHYLDENPAGREYVKNPKPRPRVFRPFTWEEVERVAAAIDPRYAAVPIFAAGTGLRPEELFALERRDVDRVEGVVSVERVYSGGRLKECSKSSRQRRRVPLRASVLEALAAHPARVDTPLLFPGPMRRRDRTSDYVDLEAWRHRFWAPALAGARLTRRRLYDLRHTYATLSLDAGVSLFTLSRRMGTSIAMIDQTYGHLVDDNEQAERDLLDAYDAAQARQR